MLSAVPGGTIVPMLVMLAVQQYQVFAEYTFQAFGLSLPISLAYGSVVPLTWVTFRIQWPQPEPAADAADADRQVSSPRP